MSNLSPVAASYAVTFDRYLAKFGAVTQPAYAWTDEIARDGLSRTAGYCDLSLMELGDDDACLHPRKVFVCHDQIVNASAASGIGYPTVNWGTPAITGPLSVAAQPTKPFLYKEVQLGCTAMTDAPTTTFTATAALSPCTQGFLYFHEFGAEQVDPDAPCSMELLWQLGSAANGAVAQKDSSTWYKLRVALGGTPEVFRSTDGGTTFTKLGDIQTGGRRDAVVQPFTVQNHLVAEVTFLGGRMQVSLDSPLSPWSSPEFNLYPAVTSLSGGTTNGSNTITSATGNFTSADIGQAISGPGIPPGSIITGVVSPTSVTISNLATATASGVTLSIPGRTTTDFPWCVTHLTVNFVNIDKARFSAHPTKWLASVPQMGRAFADGQVIAGQNQLYSGTANFTTADLGDTVSGPGIPPGTTIIQIVSPTSVLLSANATATSPAVSVRMGNPVFSSGRIPLGFKVQNQPSFRTHFAPQSADAPIRDTLNDTTGWTPPGSMITASTDTFSGGTTLEYDLQFTNAQNTGTLGGVYQNTAFADYTGALRNVTISYPQIVQTRPSSPVQSVPTGISVSWTFDFDSLSLVSSATLDFNNYDGIAGAAVDGQGHFAASIDLAISGYPLQRVFTGIANCEFEEISSGGGKSTVRVHCADGWLPLQAPVWNLPDFSGWNCFYLAAFLFGLGGVTRDRLDFAQFVPSDPYAITPGDSRDENGNFRNTFFLSWSPAGVSTTHYTGGQRPAQILQRIARQIGFLTCFNSLGHAVFTPFVPPPVKSIRTFSDSDTDDLRGVWKMEYSGSLRNTRNRIVTIGFDPHTSSPIAGFAEDPKAFDDTLQSFQGFMNTSMESDSQFTSQEYASATANNRLAYFKFPERLLSLTGWMPPGDLLAPLQQFDIDVPRSGSDGKTFIVYGLTYSIAKGVSPSMSVKGRWYREDQSKSGSGLPVKL